VRLFHIDSFTDRPFSGNPAGVVLLDEPRDAAWMQAVAAELNLPETAFLEADPGAATDAVAGCYGLRWFSPTVEIDLCGHATLASAHALWQLGEASTLLRFATRSGELTATRADDGIVLDFPVDPPEAVDAPTAERVASSLGVTALWVGRGRNKFFVLVDAEDTVRSTTPDFAAVRALPADGVIVTAPATMAEADFVSRFFAPAIGIDEDPVTGSAHCCLAPFWSERLGRSPLVGYQASARGGSMTVQPDGDRVRLTGRAVTVLRGEIS
jgi:PhzF family phenazine biosynthesis protein